MVEKKSYPAAKAASKEKLATSPINDLQSRFLGRPSGYYLRERFHNGNTGFILIENIENLLIGIGNSLQCRIKQSCKLSSF